MRHCRGDVVFRGINDLERDPSLFAKKPATGAGDSTRLRRPVLFAVSFRTTICIGPPTRSR
jgi:hypothetical protein